MLYAVRFLALLVLTCSTGVAGALDLPFSPDTRNILNAARPVPLSPAGATFILLEHRYTVHPNGATDATFRQVYRVDHQSAVEDWAGIETVWQPSRQHPPEIQARVITSDGMVHPLDPKTVASEPVRETDSAIFSDSRKLRVPLPAVAPGAIVEFQSTIRDRIPLFDAGIARRVVVPGYAPIQRFHVVIDAAPGVDLRIASQLIPEYAITRRKDHTGTHIEYNLGPNPTRPAAEPGIPSDVPVAPYIAFSTGRSWQTIAARYASILDQRIRGSNLTTLLAGLDRSGTPTEIVTRLTARLHQNIRYTGVEFGENAILPNPPNETIKRRYGDCKDKSTLLVALLRAAGLEADVALLESGFGPDVDPGLPGLGRFNHVIVRVAADPPIWVDPSTPHRNLPAMDQGRLALIINPATTKLVKTPELASADSYRPHSIDIQAQPSGDIATAVTRPSRLFDDLPFALKNAAQNPDSKPRTTDFVITDPYRAEFRYNVIPPALFKISNPPVNQTFTLGTMTYSRQYQARGDGIFEVIYAIDTGKRRITAAEFNAFVEAYRAHHAAEPETFTFLPVTAEPLALGDYEKAIELSQQAIAANPKDAMVHARYSRVLAAAGRNPDAVVEAHTAVELDSRSAYAWESLGAVLPSEEAEPALRKAIQLDPATAGAKQNLMRLLVRANRLTEAATLKTEDPELNAALTALQQGPVQVIINAQSKYPDPRQRATFLNNVAATLSQLHHAEATPPLIQAANRILTPDY